MKSTWTKCFAILGIIGSLIVIFNLGEAFLYTVAPSLLDDGTSIYDPGLSAWNTGLFALLVSVASMLFYLVDAIICVIKAIMKIDPIFNIALAISIFVGCVFGVSIICNVLTTTGNIIWYFIYFSIFTLEIISIVKHLKMNFSRRLKMYTIYVKFDCYPEKREAFVEAVKKEGILSAILAEDGCIRYDYYYSEADENELLLIEAWESKRHQHLHIEQPHMARLREIKDDYIKTTTLGEFEIKG